MDSKEVIGSRIRMRRNELNIKGEQIYEATGISTGNLSGIETGKSLPSSTALVGLSKILDCSIDWILTGKSPISEFSTKTVSLSEDEQELIETYNKLDRRGRHRVHSVIYEELDRMKEEEKSVSSKGKAIG